MAQLDCGVQNCVYNKDKACSKGDIMVGGKHAHTSDDTCCESFAEKRGTDSYVSALEHPCRTIGIDCEACECKYNTDYRCFAEHVDIQGNGVCKCEQTCCATFIKK